MIRVEDTERMLSTCYCFDSDNDGTVSDAALEYIFSEPFLRILFGNHLPNTCLLVFDPNTTPAVIPARGINRTNWTGLPPGLTDLEEFEH